LVRTVELDSGFCFFCTNDDLASDNMDPALRPEIPASQKPCFYRTAGLPKGAYLRVGNTNRQMTEYEVLGYLSSRGQPTHDEDTVPNASLDDLDNSLIEGMFRRDITEYPRESLRESIFPPSAQRSSTVGPCIPSTAFFYRKSGLSSLESSRRDDRRSGSSRHGTGRTH